MNWIVILAGAAALAAVLVPLSAFALWMVRQIIQGEHARLLLEIKDSYVKSAASTLTGAEIERIVEQIRSDLRGIQSKLEYLQLVR